MDLSAETLYPSRRKGLEEYNFFQVILAFVCSNLGEVFGCRAWSPTCDSPSAMLTVRILEREEKKRTKREIVDGSDLRERKKKEKRESGQVRRERINLDHSEHI